MYERSPEDIGYCFIQFMEKLKELYTEYCLNKEENNTIIDTPEAIQFFSVRFLINFEFLQAESASLLYSLNF